jgi:hypothetical protein
LYCGEVGGDVCKATRSGFKTECVESATAGVAGVAAAVALDEFGCALISGPCQTAGDKIVPVGEVVVV